MEPAEIRAEVAPRMKPLDQARAYLPVTLLWFIPLQQAAHARREDANKTASRSNAFAAFRPIAKIVTRIDYAISAGDRQADLSRPRLFPGTMTIFTRAVLIKSATMDRRNQDGPLREAGTAGATHAF